MCIPILRYALAHFESSVRVISKACSYSKLTAWNITYVRCIYLSSGPCARRLGASYWFLHVVRWIPVLEARHYLYTEYALLVPRKPTSVTTESSTSPLVGECVVRNMEENLNWLNAFRWTFNIRIILSESYLTVSRRWSFPMEFVTHIVPAWWCIHTQICSIMYIFGADIWRTNNRLRRSGPRDHPA